MEAHGRAVRHRDLMFAQLTAATINFSLCRPKEHVGVEELMPTAGRRKVRPGNSRMDAAMAAERLRMTCVTQQAAHAAGRVGCPLPSPA